LRGSQSKGAAVRFRDAEAEREPDSGAAALRFRRKEGIENPPRNLGRHSGAIIADGNSDQTVAGETAFNRQIALAGEGLQSLLSVDDEVQQDLRDLIGVGPQWRQVRAQP